MALRVLRLLATQVFFTASLHVTVPYSVAMGHAANAKTLGVHLANDIVDMIERRARHRGVTKSRFAAMVFERWREMKYPALDTVDGTARALVVQEMSQEKSVAKNPQKAAPIRAAKKNRESSAVGASSFAPAAASPNTGINEGVGEKPRRRAS